MSAPLTLYEEPAPQCCYVCLAKVHESRGCDTHPATLAPAGSTWSGPGGNKWPEALQEKPSVKEGSAACGP
jgi:hypothetical protein